MRPLACMHAVHRRTTDCRVRSNIPGKPAMIPAATVILATRSSSVSITISYTRSLGLTCLDYFLWGHMKKLLYKTVVETEKDLVARITGASGTIADMPGISERTINGPTMYCVHTGQWSHIQPVPVNATAVISMLNYLLCKSSLALENAVRDHYVP